MGGGTVIREGNRWRIWYNAFDHNYKRDDAILCYAESPDGIHWSLLPEPLSRKNSDTSTPCIPDQGKYRLYTRLWDGGDFRGAQVMGYTESDHFGDFPEPTAIFSHDAQDPEGM